MTKLILPLAATAALAAASPPVRARGGPGQRPNREIIVYGTIPARARPTTTSVVCAASRKATLPYPERFRPEVRARSRGVGQQGARSRDRRSDCKSTVLAGRAGRSPRLVQVIKQLEADQRSVIRATLRKMSPNLGSAPGFLGAIQALICHPTCSGTAPWPSTASWKRREVEFFAELLSARDRSSRIFNSPNL